MFPLTFGSAIVCDHMEASLNGAKLGLSGIAHPE